MFPGFEPLVWQGLGMLGVLVLGCIFLQPAKHPMEPELFTEEPHESGMGTEREAGFAS